MSEPLHSVGKYLCLRCENAIAFEIGFTKQFQELRVAQQRPELKLLNLFDKCLEVLIRKFGSEELTLFVFVKWFEADDDRLNSKTMLYVRRPPSIPFPRPPGENHRCRGCTSCLCDDLIRGGAVDPRNLIHRIDDEGTCARGGWAIAKDARLDRLCLEEVRQLLEQFSLASAWLREDDKDPSLLKKLLFSEGLFADDQGSRDVNDRKSSPY